MTIDPAVNSTLTSLKEDLQKEIQIIKESIVARINSMEIDQKTKNENLENPFTLELVMENISDIEMHAYDLGALESSKEILGKINHILEYTV